MISAQTCGFPHAMPKPHGKRETVAFSASQVSWGTPLRCNDGNSRGALPWKAYEKLLPKGVKSRVGKLSAMTKFCFNVSYGWLDRQMRGRRRCDSKIMNGMVIGDNMFRRPVGLADDEFDVDCRLRDVLVVACTFALGRWLFFVGNCNARPLTKM